MVQTIYMFKHKPDAVLIIIIAVLIVFGLIMLSSASSVIAYSQYGSSYYFFTHQLSRLVLGLIIFWFFFQKDYRCWKKYSIWFLIGSIALLILVFIPGLGSVHGKSQSWIDIGYSLQPSELVKLSFLFYLSAWLANRKAKLDKISQGIGPFIAVLIAIAFLMLLQPDLGTLSIITLTALIVYFVGGGKIWHLFVITIIGALLFSAVILSNEYQLNRFKCVFNSDSDSCYQINQSLIAVGSGGLFGRGFGQSRQKFMYLPEVSGDSIFAIIGEELGLIAGSLLIMTYILLFYRGILIAKRAPDDFGRILAIGISSWIIVQVIINIGGMINLIPMTGVPLPFISYGGSALVSVLAAMGVLANISKARA